MCIASPTTVDSHGGTHADEDQPPRRPSFDGPRRHRRDNRHEPDDEPQPGARLPSFQASPPAGMIDPAWRGPSPTTDARATAAKNRSAKDRLVRGPSPPPSSPPAPPRSTMLTIRPVMEVFHHHPAINVASGGESTMLLVSGWTIAGCSRSAWPDSSLPRSSPCSSSTSRRSAIGGSIRCCAARSPWSPTVWRWPR